MSRNASALPVPDEDLGFLLVSTAAAYYYEACPVDAEGACVGCEEGRRIWWRHYIRLDPVVQVRVLATCERSSYPLPDRPKDEGTE